MCLEMFASIHPINLLALFVLCMLDCKEDIADSPYLHFVDNASPECNLTRSCSFYMGEIAMSIRKVSCHTHKCWVFTN